MERRLGVSRLSRKQTVILADGRDLEAEVGLVMVRIGDRSAASTVVITDCDEPLLGVEALEGLGLAVGTSNLLLASAEPPTAHAVRVCEERSR